MEHRPARPAARAPSALAAAPSLVLEAALLVLAAACLAAAAAAHPLAAQEPGAAPAPPPIAPAPPLPVPGPDDDVLGPLGLTGGMRPATYRALRDSLWRATDARDAAAAYRLGRRLTAAWTLDAGVWGRYGLGAAAAGHPREALDALGRSFALGSPYQSYVALQAAGVAARIGEREAALADSVPRLSDGEILLGMQRTVALLGDGHSVVYGIREGEPPSARAFLPVVFWGFDDGLFVVDADSAHRDLLGSRVRALGGLPADTVLARLAPYVSHDNAMTVRWLGVRFYMRSPAWLRAVGAAADTDRVEITVETDGGGERTVALRPTHDDLPRKLRWPWRRGPAPLWLQDADTNYWMRWLPDRGVLYVQFNQVRDREGLPLSAFARRLRARIDSTGARAVVVDVRRNNGGDNGLLEPLLRTLAWFDADRPGNRIFVVMDRNTFSAAQNFLARVERRTDATFVGEPSGSRPDVVGEGTNVVLPYSRAVLSISARYWQDSDPGDERPWISPDMPVGLPSEAFFAGRDPSLEAVFEALEADRTEAPGG